MGKLARLMTPPKKPGPPPSRYPWKIVGMRITYALMNRKPAGENELLTVKTLAARLHIGEASLKKKIGAVTERGKPARTPFTIEEAGQIAEIYGAPGCWPFKDWE